MLTEVVDLVMQVKCKLLGAGQGGVDAITA